MCRPTPSRSTWGSVADVGDATTSEPSTGHSGGTAADLHCLPYSSAAVAVQQRTPAPLFDLAIKRAALDFVKGRLLARLKYQLPAPPLPKYRISHDHGTAAPTIRGSKPRRRRPWRTCTAFPVGVQTLWQDAPPPFPSDPAIPSVPFGQTRVCSGWPGDRAAMARWSG